jgi:hypothetical protein
MHVPNCVSERKRPQRISEVVFLPGDHRPQMAHRGIAASRIRPDIHGASLWIHGLIDGAARPLG